MKTFPFAGLLAGFILWSGAFLLLYAVQATGCKLGWQEIAVGPISLLRLLLSALLLSTLGLLYAAALLWLRPALDATEGDRHRLLRIAKLVHLAAAVATLLTFGGIFWLSLC